MKLHYRVLTKPKKCSIGFENVYNYSQTQKQRKRWPSQEKVILVTKEEENREGGEKDRV